MADKASLKNKEETKSSPKFLSIVLNQYIEENSLFHTIKNFKNSVIKKSKEKEIQDNDENTILFNEYENYVEYISNNEDILYINKKGNLELRDKNAPIEIQKYFNDFIENNINDDFEGNVNKYLSDEEIKKHLENCNNYTTEKIKNNSPYKYVYGNPEFINQIINSPAIIIHSTKIVPNKEDKNKVIFYVFMGSELLGSLIFGKPLFDPVKSEFIVENQIQINLYHHILFFFH